MTRSPNETNRLTPAAFRAGIAQLEIVHVRNREAVTRRDAVAVEEPLQIRIFGDPWLTTMRTPGHDHELCAGLLLAEGLLKTVADLAGLSHCGRPGEEGHGNTMDVTLAPGVKLDERRFEARRGTSINASCGVCGRRTIDDLLQDLAKLDSSARFKATLISTLTARLREEQPNFDRTGGLHAAGIADSDGHFRVVREDVGRHNATDKAIGRLLLDDALPAHRSLLVVSGRTSFELVAKAWRAGIPAIVSVSAPSSLAVATAERAGQLLVGFARDGAFNVYAGGARLENGA
jgi:FdhD protein